MHDIQWLVFIVAVLVAVVVTVIGVRYRRGKEAYLCGDCRFNNAQDCHKKERPYALICTSYREAKFSNE